MILILGGGLAGVSAAYHLKNKSSLLVEREHELGGTARSFAIKGFTFDFTGHLLHLHSPYTKKLIPKLLGNNFYQCTRKAWIFSKDTYTRYPFQAYTAGLPQNVVDECVMGFFETYLANGGKPAPTGKSNFHDWSLKMFGEGISKHFMIPYNEKLYQVSSRELGTDWCGPFVPMPKLNDVIKGSIAADGKDFGYNTTFLYPRKGGIQMLAKAMGKGLKNVRLKTSIAQINWKQKTAELSTGETVSYSHLINTVPLLELLNRMPNLPANVERAKKKLKCVSILCLNIGVKRSKISDASWIYFPEEEFPFYRVGFPMNFTPHVVPRGCSSMYVEVPMNASKPYSKKKVLADVRRGLIKARILKPSDKLPVVQFLPIKYAYVIYNKNRKAALDTIFRFLKQNRIQSIGRYGAWKYSFMEEAILDGKKAAENL